MNTLGWQTITFALILILMVIGLVTLLFSRSSYAKIKAMPFALANGFGVAVWLASLVYTRYVQDIFLAHRIAFSAAYILVVGMLGLALTFPNNALSRRFRQILAADVLLGAVCVGLLLFTDRILTAANFYGAKPMPFSVLGDIYLFILAAHLVASITIFVRRYLKEIRNRLYFNYVVLAFIVFFLIAAITNIVLPLAGVVAFALVGPLAALLPFLTIVYALGITDIDDINYVIAQLLQVGARLALVVGLFVAGGLVHHILRVEYYSSGWFIAISLIACAGVVSYYLIGKTLDRYIENRIAYARMSPDEARNKAIIGLSGAIELDRNVSLVLKLIRQTIGIRAVGIALVAKDGIFWESGDFNLVEAEVHSMLKTIALLPARRASDQALLNVSVFQGSIPQTFETQGIAAVKPLRTQSGVEGLYVLGEKFSQEIFTKQDSLLMHAVTEIGDLSIERALFYNQIQSFAATLQQRVDDATKRLRRANNKLKALDALKDDFISMASHQLRSPATSVRDAIGMLEQSYLTSQERHKILQLADASSERLVSVVTDMLSVARIQAGHFTVEKTEVDMGELIERAALQASGLAKEKDITIAFTKPKTPLLLQADRAKVNEMMANYIENAIKYSDEHTTVTITLALRDGQLHFDVDDQGIGVPASEQKDLFTKFYRATNARKEQPNGNGIGLFVVKMIAEVHGGGAYYEPLEHGSRFGFWLPK